MIDWGQALDIGISGAPEAAVMVFVVMSVVWAAWFLWKIVRGVVRLFRGKPRPAQPRPTRAFARVRVEPVLGPVLPSDVTGGEGLDRREFQESIEALARRVDALERRLAALGPPPGPGRTLRVVKSDELTPA